MLAGSIGLQIAVSVTGGRPTAEHGVDGAGFRSSPYDVLQGLLLHNQGKGDIDPVVD